MSLCDPMDYIVHGILQARILEWVAFPFSRGSSQPRDQTQVSNIASGFFTSWVTREAPQTDIKAWGPGPLAWGCWQNSASCNCRAGIPTFLLAVSQGHSQQPEAAAASCPGALSSTGQFVSSGPKDNLSSTSHLSYLWTLTPASSFKELRGSPVVQWLRIHPPAQGTWVQSLVWEEPTGCRAAKSESHRYRSPHSTEPTLCTRRSHRSQKPHTSAREKPPLTTTRERPFAATKAQHSQNW